MHQGKTEKIDGKMKDIQAIRDLAAEYKEAAGEYLIQQGRSFHHGKVDQRHEHESDDAVSEGIDKWRIVRNAVVPERGTHIQTQAQNKNGRKIAVQANRVFDVTEHNGQQYAC